MWDDSNDGVMVDPEDDLLKLPEDFVKKMDEWISFYVHECHDKHHNFKKHSKQVKKLRAEGQALAQKLKRMHPECDIVYMDEAMKQPLPIKE